MERIERCALICQCDHALYLPVSVRNASSARVNISMYVAAVASSKQEIGEVAGSVLLEQNQDLSSTVVSFV